MRTIDRNKAVLEMIKKRKSLTKNDICIELKLSKSTVNRHLRYLKNEYPEIIIKAGNGGGIFWEDTIYLSK